MRPPLLALLMLLLCAILAPWIMPGDPLAGSADALLAPLQSGHTLGTDDLGRDILAMQLHGSRVSLLVGLASSA